jgi:cation diffusion facilitator CzcD-associated flavoprotein CzcO
MARNKPEKVKQALTKRTRKALGDKYDPVAFTPPYNPWNQRLCLVPDGDMFEAIKAGKAEVVTDHIERIDATGIQLKSGQHLDADIIITATGLRLAIAGKIAISLEGKAINWAEHFYYKGAMFSNVPNLSAVFGYLNASWTLRADLVSEYVCKVLNQMDAVRAVSATPLLPENHGLVEDDIFDFSSGYIQRGKHIMPKNADALPWRLNQDYRKDREDLKTMPIDDGVLKFGAATVGAEILEAAE